MTTTACRLAGAYMMTPHSPLPRPLLAHWPRQQPGDGTAAAAGNIPGHVLDLLVSPHFSQPNALEFDHALQWRTLQRQASAAQHELQTSHQDQLHDLMLAGLQVRPKLFKSMSPWLQDNIEILCRSAGMCSIWFSDLSLSCAEIQVRFIFLPE